jgi:chromosome segregation ATPase
METTMMSMVAVEDYEKVVLDKEELIRQKDSDVSSQNDKIEKKGKTISTLNHIISNMKTKMSVKEMHIRNMESQMSAKDLQIATLEGQIGTNKTQITKLKAHVTTLNNAQERDADRHWFDYFQKVMDEVDRIQQGNSQSNENCSIRRGAKRFLTMMNSKASDALEHENLPLGMDVKHKLERDETMSEEGAKRVKVEREE